MMNRIGQLMIIEVDCLLVSNMLLKRIEKELNRGI